MGKARDPWIISGGDTMAERNYHDQLNIDNTVKLRTLLEALPRFCRDFFRGIEPTTSSRTRIAYAYDLGVFFEFLKNSNPTLKNTPIPEIKLEILTRLKQLILKSISNILLIINQRKIKKD
jgi:hypothetical protein